MYNQIGKIAIGSRLRRLSEQISEEASQIYQLYEVGLQPKWFPVFYVLSKGQEKTISAIAQEIGHSQPSVSKIVREMAKKKIVLEKKDSADKRKNLVSLTELGLGMNHKIEDQYQDMHQAIGEIFAETNVDLWQALEEWEYLLAQKPLLARIKEQRKQRESTQVEIVTDTPEYQQVFRALNVEWITTYFKMEAADYRALDDPDHYILQKGGHILVALYKKEPLGVCAMIKMENSPYDYELAKMAVSPRAQGKNLGWLLGQAIVQKARELGASTLYLESNTLLKPAISLYQKLGFQKVVGGHSPYERCNIQMELKIR
jgi:DNA-binding MarR family transcriptional regulator/predicted GNAT family N-acyltransferase